MTTTASPGSRLGDLPVAGQLRIDDVAGTAVQRIIYAENEVNYCPRCQTGGKLLADRSLSRLLKSDWPRTIDEAESTRFPPS